MTDNDIPKVGKKFIFVVNEDGEMDAARTLEQAAGRLDQNYAGNILRAVEMTIHMAPARVQDVGDIIIPDEAGITFRLTEILR